MASSPKPTAKSPTGTGADVQGAAPYKPRMTKSEVLAEILRVSGAPARLREMRPGLPVAQLRGSAAAQRPSRTTRRPGRQPISSGTVPSPPPGADLSLTTEQRLVLIDQAMLMLQELYAHLSLKRALHAIDPIQRLQLLRLRHAAL